MITFIPRKDEGKAEAGIRAGWQGLKVCAMIVPVWIFSLYEGWKRGKATER